MDGDDCMFRKDNGRVIPKKNYVYLGLIFILSLMVIYYCYMWYQSYKESLLQNSIMDDYLNVIHFNEVDDYIIENKNALVYVSVLGDEEINEFELNFVNTIADYSLRDVLLYMDVSSLDKSVVDNKFGNSSDYPFIVVYTNGKITDVYNISDKGYSTKKIIQYLNRIGAFEND